MHSIADDRKRIEDIRCPDISGLSAENVHMLHHSFVGIIGMRRSIESADRHVEDSRQALTETYDLLGRLKADGL